MCDWLLKTAQKAQAKTQIHSSCIKWMSSCERFVPNDNQKYMATQASLSIYWALGDGLHNIVDFMTEDQGKFPVSNSI